MKAYKGFNKDMTCRGFQFEEGKTYEEKEARLCEKGFHACLNPLDCMGYYFLNNSVYHEVELDGVSDERHAEDTKVAAKKITIGARLDIAGMVKGAIDFVFASVKKDMNGEIRNDDDSAQMASSGYSAQMASSGYYAKMASSGDYAKMELNGEYSVGAAIGVKSVIKGKVGCWITLAEYNAKCNVVCVKSAQIDGKKIKADTWYKLQSGEFVKVEE